MVWFVNLKVLKRISILRVSYGFNTIVLVDRGAIQVTELSPPSMDLFAALD